jgi:hypothetical protein
MRTTLKILGIGFISLCWSGCKDAPKFDNSNKAAQAKEIKPADEASEDAEATQAALEPVPIGGAYLACRFEVITDNNEVWCRLEENEQPVLVNSSPTLENWVFTQNNVPYDATPSALDPSTGWQWAIKIPQDISVDVSLDIFINGMRFHFSTTISSMPPTEDEIRSRMPGSGPSRDRRYAYGGNASFVVDNNPFSLEAPASCLPPEEEEDDEDVPPDPSLPNMRFFVKAQSFHFPFKMAADNILSISLAEICGQTRPIHYAELLGPGVNIRAPIPVGAKHVVVAQSTTLPPGDYEVRVHFVPRSFADLQSPESFAFGKLLLESSGELTPGRAYINNKKPD